MAKSEFPRYIEEVLQLKQEYEGKIDVLLGVESDYFPDHVGDLSSRICEISVRLHHWLCSSIRGCQHLQSQQVEKTK